MKFTKLEEFSRSLFPCRWLGRDDDYMNFKHYLLFTVLVISSESLPVSDSGTLSFGVFFRYTCRRFLKKHSNIFLESSTPLTGSWEISFD